jgi:hypothetical protein
MTACWHPTVGPLELRRLNARLELRSEESLLATIEAPGDGWLRLHADGQTWRLVEYKPGWHFALMGDPDGETRAWYAGGAGLGGGRIVVAPDRRYRLRAWPWLNARWRLLEGGRELVRLKATGSERDWMIRVEIRREPEAATDAPLLILLACAIAVQQLWMGVSWSGD